MYKIPYKQNLPWMQDRTIFLTRHGSHAYGTNIPESDEDFRGIAIPPKEVLLGILDKFEQSEYKDPDLVIFALQKFIGLAADGNPNAIEILWTDPEDHLIKTEVGERLVAAKELFISSRIRYTFGGYAMSQLKRINSHHKFLRNPLTSPPKREDFGLNPVADIVKGQMDAIKAHVDAKMKTWDIDAYIGNGENDLATRVYLTQKVEDIISDIGASKDDLWKYAAKSLGYDTNFIALLDKERQFINAQKEWNNYQHWVSTRNPKRAKLEAKFGFDTKHGMHLVRLMRMCQETLKTGKVFVKRPDKDELLEIRNGKWTYEQLIDYARKQELILDNLYNTSSIPRAPNRQAINKLCINIVESML